MRITKTAAEETIRQLDREEEREARNKGKLSKFRKGVYDYARWIMRPAAEGDTDPERDYPSFMDYALDGATNFAQLSESANYYIYDEDIAEALATPSEIRKCTRKNGTLSNMANKRESWLDVQARALNSAYILALLAFSTVEYRNGERKPAQKGKEGK